MRGAIAAGHPLTAEAGARVLAEGGHAVDACIAAGFASWVTESPLTGPGGGGFMLVYDAASRACRVLDFFVAAPGLGLPPHERQAMESVDVDFSGGSQQVFRIGGASCAVPGAALGLETAHRLFGTLPWRVLIEPAVELARGGVELTREQAYLHAILDLILRHTPESRRIYGDEARLVAGDRLVMDDLAGTMERIAEHGAADLYTGELGRAMAAYVRDAGGDLTADDLSRFRVIRRRPLSTPYAGHTFVTNPPPSSGGILVAYALRLLDELGGNGAGPGTAEAMAQLAEVMREQSRARGAGFDRALFRGGLQRRLDAAVDDALARMRAGAPGVREHAPAGGTTHISVVDAERNAAALTVSTGAGSGMVVPGTGIHLNNMLGEFDLPRAPVPGRRLSSMMSPSVVLGDRGPRLVAGSAGSLRLRGAVLQIVVNVVGHGLRVDDAIERPRVHLDEPFLHCEGGADGAELDRLEAMGYTLTRWRRRNLFFGGVSAVEMLPDGALAAAGDPRRGGAGVVVAA